ncbi:MAG: NTP transferase domain-containing protein [Candidatus Latescibacterota bacterium]|nr:NTP transferase domain-containing protein [Candidatus Latescibacterota bacterium]
MSVAAVLTCRNNSSRLYAKPLQRIGGRTILEHIIAQLQTCNEVDHIVLAISEQPDNWVYTTIADRLGLPWLMGDDTDMLQRLILGAKKVGADQVLRMTPDGPFLYWEGMGEFIQDHVKSEADYSIHDGLPLGSFYELIKTDALERCHQEGEDRHRSEYSTLYIYENKDRFVVRMVPVDKGLDRKDIRIVVDTPEDLIVCQSIFEHVANEDGLVPIRPLIRYLDMNPKIKSLNQAVPVNMARYW